MTIAACYVSPEGVVLGADSTSTYGNPNGPHYYNHAQKLFQIGENSTLGMVTWGLGGLATRSHRMLMALLADDLMAKPATSVADVAQRWTDQFWAVYNAPPVNVEIQRCQALAAKKAYDATVSNDPDMRTHRRRAVMPDEPKKRGNAPTVSDPRMGSDIRAEAASFASQVDDMEILGDQRSHAEVKIDQEFRLAAMVEWDED